MKRSICVMLAAMLLGSLAVPSIVEAGDDRRRRQRRAERQYDERYRDRHYERRYFRDRDVYVIREYYRPYHRPLPRGIAKKYRRTGYLPPGWAKRVRPVPVYIERELVMLPHGFHRGIIDGHAVVYNSRGTIIDVAVLF